MIKLLVQTVFLLSTLTSQCVLVLAWSSNQFSFGGSPPPPSKNHHPVVQSIEDAALSTEEDPGISTRRAFLGATAMNICLIGYCTIPPPSVWAAENEVPTAAVVAVAATTTTTATTATTIYKSGKMPMAPGDKPKDKNDVRGTRKDPDFLRSVADCRSQCQNSVGSDGYARAKEDCLSECQDICCKTYEQCTFDIVPRI